MICLLESERRLHVDGHTGNTKLYDYLAFAGILACNVNPYLPSLSDIGCEWNDMTGLVDRHELFYCKAYRKRTTFLSNEVYFLLKECRPAKQLDENAARVWSLLEKLGTADAQTLREAALMERGTFLRAIDTLLGELRITAFQNGKILNPNWSAFVYCTADAWERHVKKPAPCGDPRQALKQIVTRTMPEKEFLQLIRKKSR